MAKPVMQLEYEINQSRTSRPFHGKQIFSVVSFSTFLRMAQTRTLDTYYLGMENLLNEDFDFEDFLCNFLYPDLPFTESVGSDPYPDPTSTDHNAHTAAQVSGPLQQVKPP